MPSSVIEEMTNCCQLLQTLILLEIKKISCTIKIANKALVNFDISKNLA